ncbi:MAG: DNA repair protein [Candidatus Nitrosotenuis sp.]
MQINLEHTINSGQVFLWQRHGNKWYGINGSDVLAVDESGGISTHSGRDWDLFRQGDDYDKIMRDISKDKTIRNAARRYAGLRLMRQDPFQCYITFIVSSNSSIRNIRLTLHRLSKKFGKKVRFEQNEFYLFPEPGRLAGASRAELLSCGLGYRAEFVKGAANAVKEKTIGFGALKKADYRTARESLLGVHGIGNKVADCILLFSLEKLESFPLDRWIVRSLQKYYPSKFSFEGKTLTDKKYQTLHDQLVDYFGPYAGYCQQFLFKMVRDSNDKTWL